MNGHSQRGALEMLLHIFCDLPAANNYGEVVQICRRALAESDGPEGGVSAWRAKAAQLWKLLDSIDTLDDACREHDAAFRKGAYGIQRRRFEFMSGEEVDATFKLPPPQPEAGAGVAKDAARYRWLRRCTAGEWDKLNDVRLSIGIPMLDADIDAAMSSATEGVDK